MTLSLIIYRFLFTYCDPDLKIWFVQKCWRDCDSIMTLLFCLKDQVFKILCLVLDHRFWDQYGCWIWNGKIYCSNSYGEEMIMHDMKPMIIYDWSWLNWYNSIFSFHIFVICFICDKCICWENLDMLIHIRADIWFGTRSKFHSDVVSII